MSRKARQLLAKGLKFRGGNEYIYQTLALLEAKANRYEQARYLFSRAWAQLEMQRESNLTARQLFEKAVQASPKNRFAWHVWGVFEYNMGNIEVSIANLLRLLFRRASELDPRHQLVWITWGVLEQSVGNLSLARRLFIFKSSLNINSQSYITWMACAQLEEDQRNSVRAEEIRTTRLKGQANIVVSQLTEVVDDASWVMGFLDIIELALGSIKKLLNMDRNQCSKTQESLRNISEESENSSDGPSRDTDANFIKSGSGFNLEFFIKERLSLDPTKLDIQLEPSGNPASRTVL
ncbi:protein high chlorophyll fluorescent 107-like [Hevea brasiliensis]|uniref:protein high chlorophyll fluorescent 107-like n=1 Tax=Hevea brasiliensis TaxID=3981 RepID=UPI0025CD55AA|nr:protein high chlorophyll fluorescent 107-like [Hevea brasiliensis]